jgi:undecaprenyl-diphosphatase
MNIIEATVLGLVEGLTEFLPVSSTGHLTVVEKMFGLNVDDNGVTAFTAVIQLGPIVAVLLYFWHDIYALARAWLRGLTSSTARQDPQWRFAWLVILGSLPIGIVGFVARDAITAIRSLWIVAGALILWSGVMVFAERRARQDRGDDALGVADVVFIGVAQCVALIPGISRSGATISAGLLRGVDRSTATRLSFFLAIPAMVGAGGLEVVSEASAVSSTIGWGPTLLATLIAFIVGWASIAWLLRLVAHHPISVFVPYRVTAGLVVLTLLVTGVVPAS